MITLGQRIIEQGLGVIQLRQIYAGWQFCDWQIFVLVDVGKPGSLR